MQALPPSQRDGLRPEQVAAFKRTAINTIIDAGTRLHMDQIAIATAVVFLHRFYAAKSLVRNDPFLVSVACLYLGGKVEDSPKSVRDVLMASCELRYKEETRRLVQEREFYEALREKVFIAERALLYAIDFQFNVDHAYKPCIRMLNTEPLKSHREQIMAKDPRKATQLAQFAINFINDSLKTEACLHFSGEQIAAACIWLSMKLLKQESHIYTDQGQLWWVSHGVQEDHLEGVEDLLQDVYSRNLYATYSDNTLVFQSAALLSPQQVQAAAIAVEKQRLAAAAAAQQGGGLLLPLAAQQQAGLPAAIAAANRESWALTGAAVPAEPASLQPPPPAEAAPAGQGEAAGRERQQADDLDDYDDLLANL